MMAFKDVPLKIFATVSAEEWKPGSNTNVQQWGGGSKSLYPPYNKILPRHWKWRQNSYRCERITTEYQVVVQLLSCVPLFGTPGLQPARLPCSSPSPGACSNSCPLSRWCHPTISSSVTHFSSCLQSFPASGSFPTSWLFVSGGHSIGASVSVFPMNIQDSFPFGLTGLISLLSKGLSRVFSNTTV